MSPRIPPIQPPFAPEIRASLDKWMPPGAGVEPLELFRTIVRHERLSERMRGLGAALLGRALVPPRVREILVLRTCARCGAEYEWGVHVTAFAASVGLDDAVVRATFERSPATAARATDDDAILFRLADELHDTAAVSDATWGLLAARFGDAELLEMMAIVGFYHLVSFVANGAAVEREPWAARFPA